MAPILRALSEAFCLAVPKQRRSLISEYKTLHVPLTSRRPPVAYMPCMPAARFWCHLQDFVDLQLQLVPDDWGGAGCHHPFISVHAVRRTEIKTCTCPYVSPPSALRVGLRDTVRKEFVPPDTMHRGRNSAPSRPSLALSIECTKQREAGNEGQPKH